MGLDTSHDCWHGGYGGFNQFRRNLASAVGIDLDKMDGYARRGTGVPWPSRVAEPLVSLLNHSDCEGSISVEELIPLADRLEAVAALIEVGPPPDDRSGFEMTLTSFKVTDGHLTRNGGTIAAARTFAEGCRLAASLGEPVEFR